MTDSTIATRDQILGWLSEAARKGHVPAMRLLLEELRHNDAVAAVPSVIDDLARKRQAATRIG
jgi:hypothetical protein